MLSQLKDRVLGDSSNEKGISPTSLWYLIKELKCLPDILGREYEVEYDSQNRIKSIRQKPISIPTLMVLFKEMEKDYKRQEKQSKKMKKSGRRK